MIVKEYLKINDKDFVKITSDNNKLIRKVGTNEEYAEAIDLTSQNFEYEETDKDIEEENIIKD